MFVYLYQPIALLSTHVLSISRSKFTPTDRQALSQQFLQDNNSFKYFLIVYLGDIIMQNNLMSLLLEHTFFSPPLYQN